MINEIMRLVTCNPVKNHEIKIDNYLRPQAFASIAYNSGEAHVTGTTLPERSVSGEM